MSYRRKNFFKPGITSAQRINLSFLKAPKMVQPRNRRSQCKLIGLFKCVHIEKVSIFLWCAHLSLSILKLRPISLFRPDYLCFTKQMKLILWQLNRIPFLPEVLFNQIWLIILHLCTIDNGTRFLM